MGKGKNGGDQHFLLFPQCFLVFPAQIQIFQSRLCCRLQMLWIWTGLKYLSFGKELSGRNIQGILDIMRESGYLWPRADIKEKKIFFVQMKRTSIGVTLNKKVLL